MATRDFLGGPVVKTVLTMQGVWVRFLVRELGTKIPHGCLWPYHPEHAPFHLISETKQGWAWLVLGGRNKYHLLAFSFSPLPQLNQSDQFYLLNVNYI